jgi:hypothetical protein
MPSTKSLTREDRALLRQAYREGPLKLAEPPASEAPSRARTLEAAGLMRSVVAITEQDERYFYFTLSGAGVLAAAG